MMAGNLAALKRNGLFPFSPIFPVPDVECRESHVHSVEFHLSTKCIREGYHIDNHLKGYVLKTDATENWR